MADHEALLEQLLGKPRMTKASINEVSMSQGVYVLWLATQPPVCLKVGIAGPRRGKGLKGRLELHFRSNPANTVLARHLMADATSDWAKGWQLTETDERRRFLAEYCFFQVLRLPQFTRPELEHFEAFLAARLAPRYAGRVRA